MKILLHEHERAIVIRNGQATEWLGAGLHRRYRGFGDLQIETHDLRSGATAQTPTLAKVVPDHEARVLEVPVHHVAVLEIDGIPTSALPPGTHLLWQSLNRVEAYVYDLRPLLVEVPSAHLPLLPPAPVRNLRVKPWMSVLLMVDGKLEATLQEGLHTVGAAGRHVEATVVDLRLQERAITGQEVMTRDKVTLRLNAVARYRITDAALMANSVPDLQDGLHTSIQLAVRRAIAARTVDELLEGRAEVATAMTEEVAAQARAWGVEVEGVDVKDVILPGDMKALLNRVIEAEKQAAAQVILRREETAATRSLANTARMLEQSPVLMRLKELEAMKELADRVGQLTIVAGAPEWARSALEATPRPAPREP